MLDQGRWDIKLGVEEFIDLGALSCDVDLNPGRTSGIQGEDTSGIVLGGLGKMMTHTKKDKNANTNHLC